MSVDGTSLAAGAATTYAGSVLQPRLRVNVQLTQASGTDTSSCSAPVVAWFHHWGG